MGKPTKGKLLNPSTEKVKPRRFEVDDLVVKKIIFNNSDPHGKFTWNYEGPYIVKKVLH